MKNGKDKEKIKTPDFVFYDLKSEKGKEIQDMILILRSIGATEDQISRVVQVNCGVPLSSRQRACL